MTTQTFEITREVAAKVLSVVDAGLSSGLGVPEPGKLCVEAAVCLALGLPHGDNPSCVAPALRSLKISLNDRNWSSNTARAAGMRRLAIAQLGSAGVLDEKEFARRVADYTIRTTVPRAMRIAASVIKDAKHKAAMIAAALECEQKGDRASAQEARKAASAAAASAAVAAYAASAASAADAADIASADDASDASDAAYAASADAYAAYAASADDAAKKRDEELATFAEGIVQILIAMNAPGCAFLDLAPLQEAA
jgi:hypothetical protein